MLLKLRLLKMPKLLRNVKLSNKKPVNPLKPLPKSLQLKLPPKLALNKKLQKALLFKNSLPQSKYKSNKRSNAPKNDIISYEALLLLKNLTSS